jgi:hypothetical protein
MVSCLVDQILAAFIWRSEKGETTSLIVPEFNKLAHD